MSQHSQKQDQHSVGIVGAGLVGSVAALAFVSKGYTVTLFEARDDPNNQVERNLRSINLAVSNRGIRTLKEIDEKLAEKVLEHVIPMKGRMIHDITGKKQESQIYGLNGECINSIDRAYLNKILLQELKRRNVKVYFQHKLVRLSNMDKHPAVETINSTGEMERFTFDYIIGADGAHSQFRYQLQKFMRMSFAQEYIDMQYIELYIPPDPKKKFAIDANHLHIWPRHDFMLIALPNQDGSFTSTFFSPWSVIESMQTGEEFVQFFAKNFPDALELIGEKPLLEAFDKNPRGSLMQVSAYPYNSPNGKAIIMGDAAHSMVPFYGQGMNCGFEDVRILMDLIDKYGIDTAFIEYSPQRKKDLDAICKLALDNYYEMSSKVTNIWYLAKKKLDYSLGRVFKNKWLPLYTMVSFRDDIPYSKAIEIEKRQTKIVSNVQIGVITSLAIYGVYLAAKLYDKKR